MIRKFANTDLDLSAAGIATACIIHCLVPPLVAAFAPALASWAEVEWIHKALALTATPISLFAISRRWGMQGAPIFVSIVLIGLGLLLLAAFVETFNNIETPLTLVGGSMLSSAHIFWWHKHRASASRKASSKL